MNDASFTSEDFESLKNIEEFNKVHWKGTGQSLGWKYDLRKNNPETTMHRELLHNIKNKLEKIRAEFAGKPQFEGLISDVQKITDGRTNRYLYHLWLTFTHGLENKPPNEPQLQLVISTKKLDVSLWFENAYSIKKYYKKISDSYLNKIKSDSKLTLEIYKAGTAGELVGEYTSGEWEAFNQKLAELDSNCKIGLKYGILKDQVLAEGNHLFDIIEQYFDQLMPLFNLAKVSGDRFIIAHIEWNDFGWTKPQIPDKPSFGYAKDGNIPHDSLNFKFDKPIDTKDKIFGYFVPGRGNPIGFVKSTGQRVIFFFSRKKIVGLYGNAEYYEKRLRYENKEFKEGEHTADISGDRDTSFGFLKECYLDVKPEYMNDKRMGRSNFIYITQQNAEKLVQGVTKVYEAFISSNPHNSEAQEHMMKLNRVRGIIEGIKISPVANGLGADNLIYKKKQIILYGPPGTGKTFCTRDLALKIVRSSSGSHE